MFENFGGHSFHAALETTAATDRSQVEENWLRALHAGRAGLVRFANMAGVVMIVDVDGVVEAHRSA